MAITGLGLTVNLTKTEATKFRRGGGTAVTDLLFLDRSPLFFRGQMHADQTSQMCCLAGTVQLSPTKRWIIRILGFGSEYSLYYSEQIASSLCRPVSNLGVAGRFERQKFHHVHHRKTQEGICVSRTVS